MGREFQREESDSNRRADKSFRIAIAPERGLGTHVFRASGLGENGPCEARIAIEAVLRCPLANPVGAEEG